MQSHVLWFSCWVSGESRVCDVLGLCLCVVSASGCLKSLTWYCIVLNANMVVFFSSRQSTKHTLEQPWVTQKHTFRELTQQQKCYRHLNPHNNLSLQSPRKFKAVCIYSIQTHSYKHVDSDKKRALNSVTFSCRSLRGGAERSQKTEKACFLPG